MDASTMRAMMLERLPVTASQLLDRPKVLDAFGMYLDLLMRWNRTVNLTSLKDERSVVLRHFVEGVHAGALAPDVGTLLDLGSGGGVPGIPIQIVRPELAVMLVEAQGRKVAFLREVVRELKLGTAVVGRRSEGLPARGADWVCLRAVDPMKTALPEAGRLAREGVMVLGSAAMRVRYEGWLGGWRVRDETELTGDGSAIFRFERLFHVER